MFYYVHICNSKMSRLGTLRIQIEQVNSRVGPRIILEWEACAGIVLWDCGYSRERPSLRRGLGGPEGRGGLAGQWGRQCPRLHALLESPGERHTGYRNSETALVIFMRWFSWGKSQRRCLSVWVQLVEGCASVMCANNEKRLKWPTWS